MCFISVDLNFRFGCKFCFSALVSLFLSVILLVNSRCSSLKLNPHLISHFILSLTSVLLQHSVVWTYKCSLKPMILLWG